MLFLFLFLLSASLACSPNCLLCDSSISLCYACKDPQLPAIGGGCQNVATRINGCLVYLNTTGCARCRLGHRLTVLMTCEMDRRGCLIFTINGSCSECGFGTRLENGSCVGVLNCLSYKPQSNFVCLECYDGFKLIYNRCVYSSPCGVVSQKDWGCQQCQAGYLPSGFSCSTTQNVIGCAFYSNTGNCLYCEYGLVSLSPNVCSFNFTPTASPRSNRAAPERTKDQVTVDIGPPPILSDPNCNVSGPLGICISCNDRYYLNYTKCVRVADECREYQVFDGRCVTCKPGLTLNAQGSCVIQRIMINHCNIMSGTETCVACEYGYYLTNNSCFEVSPLCDGYNIQTGECLKCPQKYELKRGACVPTQLQRVAEPCAQYQGTSKVCLRCIDSYFMSQSLTCEPKVLDPNCQSFVGDQCKICSWGYRLSNTFACTKINPLCKSYDVETGYCLTCYEGYNLSGSACILSVNASLTPTTQTPNNTNTTPVIVPSPGAVITNEASSGMTAKGLTIQKVQFDPNCAQNLPSGQCMKCAYGFYKSPLKCELVNPQCKSYNESNGQCLTCYDGYDLKGGYCIDTSLVDPNCAVYNSTACAQCFRDYYYNVSNGVGKCIAVSRLCQVFDSGTGTCTGCRLGYKVSSIDAHYCIDQNCVVYLQEQCQVCREPYRLINNTCVILIILQTNLTNCATSKNGECLQCVNGYFLRNGGCMKLAPLCAIVNPTTGMCLSCYNGYILSGGNCVKLIIEQPAQTQPQKSPIPQAAAPQQTNPQPPQPQPSPQSQPAQPTVQQQISVPAVPKNSDPGCKTSDKGICNECYPGYWRNVTKCQAASNQCKGFNNMTGFCLDCYPGYSLTSAGECIIPPIDLNCLTFTNAKCSKCKDSYKMSTNGTCTRVISLCATTDPKTGKCASCYLGYQLVNSECLIPPKPIANCKRSDAKVCLECSPRFVVRNGECQQVSPLCNEFNAITGDCTTCFPGYQLNNGNCLIASAPTATVNTPSIDPVTTASTACNSGFYYNGKACVPASVFCVQFDDVAKRCSSCQQGTILQERDCVMPALGVDVNCLRYVGSYCSTCTQGYYLQSFICTKIDANCKKFNPSSSICEVCSAGKPSGAKCGL